MDSDVVAAYTQPDKPRGRGRIYEPPPVKEFALQHGIEVYQPESLRRPEVLQHLASLSPDVILVVAYGKILPTEALDIPQHGCINVHPSLLPRYRGPSPVSSVILEGEERTGTTIMLMDQGMDTGPILARKAVPIDTGIATTESLTPSLFQVGAELLKEVLPLWLDGKVTPQPQDHRQATVTKKLEKGDGEARWELSAQELERRLRAFTPWPGLFTYWKGQLLKILSATPLCYPGLSSGAGEEKNLTTNGPNILVEELEPGLVVPLKEPGILVGVVAGRGVLGLKRVQIEGRRPVSCEEFLRGYSGFLGSRLPN